jgi:hypothetical protein
MAGHLSFALKHEGVHLEALSRLFAAAPARANRLSGRHVSVHDSIDTLLGSIDQIEHDDLCTLRLRTAKCS